MKENRRRARNKGIIALVFLVECPILYGFYVIFSKAIPPEVFARVTGILVLFLILLTIIILPLFINPFLREQYTLLKSFGISEGAVFSRILKRCIPVFLLTAPVYWMLTACRGMAVIKTGFFLFLILFLMVSDFFLLHFPKLQRVVKFVLYLSEFSLLLYLVIQTIQLFQSQTQGNKILNQILTLPVITGITGFFADPGILTMSILSLSFCTLLVILSKMERMIADRGNNGRSQKLLFHQKSNSNVFTGCPQFLQTLIMLLRKKKNLAYLLLYPVYAVMAVLTREYSIIFFGCSLLVLLLFTDLFETVYRDDVVNRLLYQSFAVEYRDFLRDKIISCLLLMIPLGFIQLLYLLCNPSFLIWEGILLFIILFLILYFNLFESCIYYKMRLEPTTQEITWIMLAFFGMILPVINIVLLFLYYRTGRNNWEKCRR